MNDIIVTRDDMALLGTLQGSLALSRELAHAIVVWPEAVPPDVVTLNSRVVYADEADGVPRIATIVHPQHAQGAGEEISVLAPVGMALLGLSAGQAIEWDFPDGSRRRLKVEAVLYQPERVRNSPLPRAP